MQLQSEFMAVDNMPFINRVYRKVRQSGRVPVFPPVCSRGHRLSSDRRRPARVAEGKHRSHRADDDCARYDNTAAGLSFAWAGAGAAGLDRHFLFRVAEPDCLGGPMGRSTSGPAGHAGPLAFGRSSTSRSSRRRIFSSWLCSPAPPPTIASSSSPVIARKVKRGMEPRAAWKRPSGQTGHALTARAMTTIWGWGRSCCRFRQVPVGRPDHRHFAGGGLVGLITVAPALLRAFGQRTVLALRLVWVPGGGET